MTMKCLIDIKRKLCKHEWNKESTGLRTCPKCGLRQMMFWNRRPSLTKPSLRWEDMNREKY